MATWKKAVFIIVLVAFVSLSVFISFYSIARDTYEFEYQEEVGKDDGVEGLEGYVFYGFNGNTSTIDVHVDFVRDKDGNNPDESKPVVGIDSFTMNSDEYVEYIHIGKDVQYISEQAFFYCKKLKAVFVDEENQYFCDVDGVLYTKDMSKLLLHPINNGEWQVSQGLAESADTYVIPEGVTRICGYSFYKNTELVNLTVPSSVKEIGDMAFFTCSELLPFDLPEVLESIGADTFSYCAKFGPVMYIPASVKTIDHHAFFNCTGINEVYFAAASEDDVDLGESWTPKNVKDPQFGKTYDDAAAEAERIALESAKEDNDE